MADEIKIQQNIVTNLSNDDLIKICDDMYKSDTSSLKRIAYEHHIEIDDLSEDILDEASKRFKNVFLLLIREEYYNRGNND